MTNRQKSIRVLRIGHRFVRDDRTITHLCLVSRALGAEMIYLEEVDSELAAKMEEVNKTWGGDFKVVEAKQWKKAVQEAKNERGSVVVHLTMYGLPLHEKIDEMRRRNESFMIVVGGPKVPGEVYRMSDFNVSITAQPHSEVAALAILMHELQAGEELKREFPASRIKIVPTEKGKRVELKP